jgi:hypothetical protein
MAMYRNTPACAETCPAWTSPDTADQAPPGESGTCMHLRNVSCKFVLLEGTFQHVLVGSDFAPGFYGQEVRISNGNRIPRKHAVVLSQAANGTNWFCVHLLDRSAQLDIRIGGLNHLWEQPVGMG